MLFFSTEIYTPKPSFETQSQGTSFVIQGNWKPFNSPHFTEKPVLHCTFLEVLTLSIFTHKVKTNGSFCPKSISLNISTLDMPNEGIFM